MTSIHLRQALTLVTTGLLLAAAGWLLWQPDNAPAPWIAPTFVLLAVISAGFNHTRFAPLATALLGICLQLIPFASDLLHIDARTAIWSTATALLASLVTALQTSHAKRLSHAWQDALENAPTGLILVDDRGYICSANQTAARLVGEASSQLLGRQVRELLNDDVWSSVLERWRELKRGDAITVEFEWQNSSQQTLSLCLHCKQFDNRSVPSARYLVQIIDMSGELAAKRALATATEQLKRILGASPDMVFVTDAAMRITYANAKALKGLNTNAAKLNRLPIPKLIKHSDRQEFVNAFKAFLKQRNKRATVKELNLRSSDIAFDIELIRLSTAGSASFALVCHPSASTLENLDHSKASQARFSQVFHASPDAILILRAEDTMILDFNDGFSRLLGYRREEAIGESGAELIFWKDPVERDAVIERLNREQEIIDYETTLKNKAGELVHVEISLRYIVTDNHLSILCVGRDITKRISAEAALVETEEKFAKVFAQSPDGISIVRADDGVISDMNDAFIERSGYRRDELIGASIFELEVFAVGEQLSNAIDELTREGKFTNREMIFTTKSGEQVPSLISGTFFELGGETYMMVMAKDMGQQRATEERLRRSEERFRGIFENAPIGIMLIDMQGRIFQANLCAAQLLAYDAQHMYGTHISRLVPQEDRPNLKESLNQLVNRTAFTHRSERRMICQNGLEIWTNFHVVLQRTGNGEPSYYIVQVADITDLKRGQQRMEQMAFYDTLTKLANRRLFQDRLHQVLEHCQRSESHAALLYLDLDNFKRVNDTLGHETGDILLREVAERLQQCVRQEDTVGRPGGDEFTILLHEISSPSDAGLVAEKILNHLREPLQISGHPLVVTTSIGITVMPGDGTDPTMLMRNADLAMYKAKERGRNNYQFYSEDLNTNAVKRLRTEYEIRQALERDEFVLYYQPKVSLRTRQIVGVECLIRWQHPERGLLSPDEFIEVAEETGSIIDIGSWVIRQACRTAQSLSDTHGREIQTAINISPRQFRDPNLIRTIRQSLRETHTNPSSVELEITETMLMHDVEAAQATVRRLSDLGVKLAIDDFGTGYSSLNYLKRFPINTVKVDKSFVMDIPANADDVAITKAVIAMAHQLKMEVVAEGVETREQFKFLAEQHCEYAQGYLFSKPLPLEDVSALLQQDVPVVHGQRR